jgi:hypothetical protein
MNSVTHRAGFEMDLIFHALIIQMKRRTNWKTNPSAFPWGDPIIPRTRLGEEASPSQSRLAGTLTS